MEIGLGGFHAMSGSSPLNDESVRASQNRVVNGRAKPEGQPHVGLRRDRRLAQTGRTD